MFRQDDIYNASWQDKTLDSIRRFRFDRLVSQLPPLSETRFESLAPSALRRRIEHSWLGAKHRPTRPLQLDHIRHSTLDQLLIQADCLSPDEHDLVERVLILGGSAEIHDIIELEAARALALRLWADVGLVSGKPVIEINPYVAHAAESAFSGSRHHRVRFRLQSFHNNLRRQLYRHGALDDRIPQRILAQEILCEQNNRDLAASLARCYLWASFDCVDYSEGVMLLHPAIADPRPFTGKRRNPHAAISVSVPEDSMHDDILPEEIPIQRQLEDAIAGSLRAGLGPQETARSIRFLCKQGASLKDMTDVLQLSLITLVSRPIVETLRLMYSAMPKWIESRNHDMLQ